MYLQDDGKEYVTERRFTISTILFNTYDLNVSIYFIVICIIGLHYKEAGGLGT